MGMKYIKKFELVDYRHIDFEDIDVYDGYLYVYSAIPLTKKTYDKGVIFPHNRADASDTTSEYIYKMKLKKPIYKKKKLYDYLDNAFDEKTDNIDDKYSGYFKKDWINDWIVNITNPEDIVSFNLVGGFVKYDRFKTKILKKGFSEETDSWLYSYISGSLRVPKLTEKIIDELKYFKSTEPIKIYKGLEEVQIAHTSSSNSPYKKGQTITSDFTYPTSWTTNILVAMRFIDDEPSSPPFVAEMTVDPEFVLVDVQMLPKKYYHANQREIIMLPGKYVYKIVWDSYSKNKKES